MNITELKQLDINALFNMAKEAEINIPPAMKKQEVIFHMLKEKAKNGDKITGEGNLEILPDGFGFLRSARDHYKSGPADIYVSPSQIRRFGLGTGDHVSGAIRAPKKGEKYFALEHIQQLNGQEPSASRRRINFESLTPIHPNQPFTLPREKDNSSANLTPRIMDLIAPIGKGQRGLIVSPPKAGKTMMLENLAKSISDNHPECYLMVVLIDERPEEVTEMQRCVKGEVIGSTFDESAQRQVQVAEMAIEKAKRLVENGKDVVMLLDSITRLARAYNTVMPSSGKVLTGGVDANGLAKAKQIFGAARNVEHGGSLTILGTALVNTGSRMDDIIYEEFKGTGNMEVHLDRRMAEKRVFPAININMSGTRREELLKKPNELQNMLILRKILHPMEDLAATEFLTERLKTTKNNHDFFSAMRSN
jgi:transcription termination factor Rho